MEVIYPVKNGIESFTNCFLFPVWYYSFPGFLIVAVFGIVYSNNSIKGKRGTVNE